MERCEKELSPTDVSQRLAVTKGMLEFLPPIDAEHDVPVSVLDETGKVYVFYLSCRQGKYRKPVLQSKQWREALLLAMSCISGLRKMHFIKHNTELHCSNRSFPRTQIFKNITTANLFSI
ncbi:unnamed protein product [Prunus brigantina]